MSFFHPSGTLGIYSGPMAALYDFGKKFGRKIDENFPNFFSKKNEHETRSETQFHQNRQYSADSSLYLRHDSQATSSGSGHNNKGIFFSR